MIDLDLYAASLRRHIGALAAVALAAALIAAGTFVFLASHRAEGTYTVGSLEVDEKKVPPLRYQRGIPPQDFKTIAPRFDTAAFHAFAKRVPDIDPEAARRLERALANEERRRTLLAPVYGTTRGDLRELGDAGKSVENAVLGIRISHGARERDLALRVVALAGDFIGDTVLRAAVRDVMQMRAREAEAQGLLAENTLIKTRFAASLLEEKGRSLEKLRDAFPELARSAPQQVISIVEGGQRYLAPSTQVVGVESTIADYRERISTSERTMRKGALQSAYYLRVLKLLDDPMTAATLLEKLPQVIAAAFPSGDDPDGIAAEGRNEALIELGAMDTLRTRGLQFVVPPAIVEREPTQVAAIGLMTLLAILGGGALLILAQVWWRSNRHTIGS